MTKHTQGPVKPYRSHEGIDGPYFDIDEDERAEYEAHPFTSILAADGSTVVTAHDCFTFQPGDAEHICACWNACEGINPEAVPEMLEALEAIRAEIEALVTDGTLGPKAVETNAGWIKLCKALAKAKGQE